MLDIDWLVVEFDPSEKYEFVNWDYDIPNIWKHKIHVPVSTNQFILVNTFTG